MELCSLLQRGSHMPQAWPCVSASHIGQQPISVGLQAAAPLRQHYGLSLGRRCGGGCLVGKLQQHACRRQRLVQLFAVKQQRATPPPRRQRSAAPSTEKSVPKRRRGKPAEEGDPPRWALLSAEAYSKAWNVPWGAWTVVGGMTLWAISFLVVGVVLLPLIGYSFGIKDFTQTSQMDKTYFALLNQLLETVVGLGVIGLVVKGSQPFPEDVFHLSFKHPFRKGDGWLVWGALGVVAAPVVVAATAFTITALGYPQEAGGGGGTVDAVARIIRINTPTYLSLFTVTAVLAPLLEETVFRGFLLTSLTKYMPTPAAVVVSAGMFASAHLSGRDFPQLMALGIVMGFAYVRSRNLLTPILVHGTWNGTVLTILFLLVQAGFNITDFT